MSSFESVQFYESVRFIWFLLFSEFLVPRKCHPKIERQKWTNKENWISSSLLAPLQGKIMFNWTNNHLGFSISLLNWPLRSGLNEFAEDARGLADVALWTISTKKVDDQLPANLHWFGLPLARLLVNKIITVSLLSLTTGSRGIIVEISIKMSYLSKLHSCIYLRC